jgi:RNA polymerase sigma factor (sigma-70 family)
MARVELQSAVQHLRKVIGAAVADDASEGQLLQRFVTQGDEAAFTALVQRHSALVYAVCRRVLQQDQDAEDALQATFLILARKAGSIHKRQALGSWLHGVAYRTALSARKSVCRRRHHEEKARQRLPESPATEAALRELQTLLDAEVNGLPERFRAPFILCCWEGKSRAEAAQELGWKEGTVSSRLAQARDRLRRRLARRGVTLTAALSACALAAPECPASGPMLATISRSAAAFASDRGAGTLPAHIVALAEGVLHPMSKFKVALAMTICVATVLLGSGIGGIVHGTSFAEPRNAPTAEGKPAEKAEPKLEDILNEAASAIRKTRKDDPHRLSVLEQIAVAQDQIGKRKAAQQAFAEVIEALTRPTKAATARIPWRRAFALARLARAQSLSGDAAGAKKSFATAIVAARQVVTQDNRFDALQFIAQRQAECGDMTAARTTAAGIEPELYRGQVLADIALAQAKTGDVTGAIAQGDKLDPFNRASFWLGLAEWRARHHSTKKTETALQNARQALGKVKEDGPLCRQLQRIAFVQAELGDFVAARKTFAEADARMRRSGGPGANREQFLLRLAIEQARRKDREAARQTMNEALKGVGKRNDDFEVAAVQIALGEFGTARKTIQGFAHIELRLEYLRQLAESQAKSGDLRGAYAWAIKERDPLARALALLGVAHGFRRPPGQSAPSTPQGRPAAILAAAALSVTGGAAAPAPKEDARKPRTVLLTGRLLKATDVRERTITVSPNLDLDKRARAEFPKVGGLPDQTFKVVKDVAIEIDGKPGKLTDLANLHRWCPISLRVSPDLKTAQSIRTHGTQTRGRVTAVDTVKGTVTIDVDRKGIIWALAVARGASVEIGGKPRKLADLQVGADVHLLLAADQKTARSIYEGGPQESFSIETAEVKRVNVRTNTLIVASEGGDSTYTVGASDKVLIAGKAGKLADLKEGMEVDLWSRGQLKVVGGQGRFVRTTLTITARQPRP